MVCVLKKALDKDRKMCYNNLVTGKAEYGQVSEWFKEPVLKTGDTATYRGFESHPVRQIFFNDQHLRIYPSGEGAPLLRE